MDRLLSSTTRAYTLRALAWGAGVIVLTACSLAPDAQLPPQPDPEVERQLDARVKESLDSAYDCVAGYSSAHGDAGNVTASEVAEAALSRCGRYVHSYRGLVAVQLMRHASPHVAESRAEELALDLSDRLRTFALELVVDKRSQSTMK